jgi:hypothetical protein
MKHLLVLTFLLIGLELFSESDSTIIKFSGVDNRDLMEITELLDIQLLNITCDDTLVRGRRFFISFSEYKNGNIIKQDTSYSYCKEETIPIQMGDNIANMIVNLCDKITFSATDNHYEIKLIGKLNDKDSFKLNIRHPGLGYSVVLKGDYSLRPVNSCTNRNELKVPINKKVPIVTYAPPVKAVSGRLSSYCIQGEEDVESWFKTFKMKHYYVIYLRIQ